MSKFRQKGQILRLQISVNRFLIIGLQREYDTHQPSSSHWYAHSDTFGLEYMLYELNATYIGYYFCSKWAGFNSKTAGKGLTWKVINIQCQNSKTTRRGFYKTISKTICNVKTIEDRFCNVQATCNVKSVKKESNMCKPCAM